ncbi:hypothetical protein GCM10020256_29260 [Streptomyces thermocoprophilus]
MWGRMCPARVRAADSSGPRSGGAVGAARGGHAQDCGADAAEFRRAGGLAETGGEHPAQFGGAEGAGLRARAVADRGDAGGDGCLGQGQAERAESDDGEICGHGVGRPSQ